MLRDFEKKKKNLRDIAAFIPEKDADHSYIGKRDISELRIFDPDKIDSDKLASYKKFVSSIWPKTENGILKSGISQEKVGEFLDRNNYNVVESKFWLQFPILYRIIQTNKLRSEKRNLKEGFYKIEDQHDLLNKDFRCLSTKEMEKILKSYYIGIKENKTSAEIKWKEKLEYIINQDSILCREINQLYNQAIAQEFSIPYEFKKIREQGAKLAEEVNSAMKSSRSINQAIKLKEKILDGKVIPVNFKKLNDKVDKYVNLKNKVDEALESEITFKDFKALTEKLNEFNDFKFKEITQKFNRLKLVNTKINNFMRNVHFNTRGSSSDVLRFDEAQEIVEEVRSSKVKFENFEEFRKKFEDAQMLIKQAEKCFEDEGYELTLDNTKELISTFKKIGFKTKIVSKLKLVADGFKKLGHVKKKIYFYDRVEKNLEILEEVKESNIHNEEVRKVENTLQEFLKWKKTYQEFEQTKFKFSLEEMMENPLKSLFPFQRIEFLLESSKTFKIEEEKLIPIKKKIGNYLQLVTKPMSTIEQKLEKVKTLYEIGISIEGFSNMIETLKNQIIFMKRVYKIFDYFKISLIKNKDVENLKYSYEEDSKKDKMEVVEDLLMQREFGRTNEYIMLQEMKNQIERWSLEADRAIRDKDEQMIARLIDTLEEKPMGEYVMKKLLKAKRYLNWRETIQGLIMRDTVRDEEVNKHIDTVIINLKLINSDERSRYVFYDRSRVSLKFLWNHSKVIEEFINVGEIMRLVSESKNFEFEEDSEDGLKVVKLKNLIHKVNSLDITEHPNYSELEIDKNFDFFKIPIYLTSICYVSHLKIKTKPMIDMYETLQKVSDLESQSHKISLKVIKKNIKYYARNLQIWTPVLGRLEKLRDFAMIVISNNRQMLARVSKFFVRTREEMVTEFQKLDLDEFVITLDELAKELIINREFVDKTYTAKRKRREKKKNQFYRSKNLEIAKKRENDLKGLAKNSMLVTVNVNSGDTGRYCICRRPNYDQIIECDFCSEWFHIDCLGINKSSINKIKRFKCPVCCFFTLTKVDNCKAMYVDDRCRKEEFEKVCDNLKELQDVIALDPEEKYTLRLRERYSRILGESDEVFVRCDGILKDFKRNQVDLENVNRGPINSLLDTINEHTKSLLGLPFSSLELILKYSKYHRLLIFTKNLTFSNSSVFLSITQIRLNKELLDYFKGSIQFEQIRATHKLLSEELETANELESVKKFRADYAEYRGIMEKVQQSHNLRNCYSDELKTFSLWKDHSQNLKLKVQQYAENVKNSFMAGLVKIKLEEEYNILRNSFPFKSEVEKQIVKILEDIDDKGDDGGKVMEIEIEGRDDGYDELFDRKDKDFGVGD